MSEEIQHPKPWERQPAESAESFEAFARYRDMGPGRTLEAAAGQAGKHPSLLKRWSTRYGWQERVAAWDAEQDRPATEAAGRAARRQAADIRWRQLQDGRDLQRLARAGVAQLIERDPVSNEPRLKRELKVTEIVALYRFGAELERLATDNSTELSATTAADESDGFEQMLRGLPQEDFQALLEASRTLSRDAQAPAQPGHDHGKDGDQR